MSASWRMWVLVAAVAVIAQAGPAAAAGVPGDVLFSRKESAGDFPVAYFPHWVHRMKFRCYVCHESIFKMKRGENDLSMATMSAGKSCGTCHNGKIAWAIDGDSCARCHVARE